MRKNNELHRIVETHSDPTVGGWQVSSMSRIRPARFFPTRASAEAYLVKAGAEYVPETGKWEGGHFDE